MNGVTTDSAAGAAHRVLHFVVPDGVDDPARVSGGNVYDRRLCAGLVELGWNVRMREVAVGDGLDTSMALAAIEDDSLVLVDGLVAVRAADACARESDRLRLVVLAHMVAARLAPEHERADTADAERRAIAAARRVVVTSGWTRDELVSEGLADADRVVVARPGADSAEATVASGTGGRLICVGSIAPHKGQDLLLRALADFADASDSAGASDWTCTLVGSLDADPDFVAALEALAESAGLGGRIRFAGVLTGERLADAYSTADLLVAPSRAESYGMAVAEALARGIPVVAARVGGLPEAIGEGGAGVLVPPDDPWALQLVLRQWWSDASRRSSLKAAALRRRHVARTWHDAAFEVGAVLGDVEAGRQAPVGAGRLS